MQVQIEDSPMTRGPRHVILERTGLLADALGDLLAKSEVKGYTRGDGTVVKPHQRGDNLHHAGQNRLGFVRNVKKKPDGNHEYEVQHISGVDTWRHNDVKRIKDHDEHERDAEAEAKAGKKPKTVIVAGKSDKPADGKRTHPDYPDDHEYMKLVNSSDHRRQAFDAMQGRKGGPIKKGERVRIKPEYQDAGDDKFEWHAHDDEEKGGLKVKTKIPGMQFDSHSDVSSHMVERHGDAAPQANKSSRDLAKPRHSDKRPIKGG
jgi:hypothetical protein